MPKIKKTKTFEICPKPTSTKCHRNKPANHGDSNLSTLSNKPSHPPAAPPHRSHVVGVMGLQWHAAPAAADHVLQGFARLCHDILGQGQQGDGEEDGWWVMGDPNPNPPDSDLDVCCRMRMMMMMVMMMVIPHANTDVSSCCEWNCCIYLDIFPALTQLIKKTGLQSTGITSKTAMQWPGRVHIEKTHRLMTPQNQDVTTNYILGL